MTSAVPRAESSSCSTSPDPDRSGAYPLISDPWFYVAAVPAVILAGISKGGLGGGGLAVMAVPLMSLIVAPPQAAAIMLPVLCAMDAMGIWVYRRAWSGQALRIVIPAAVVGIAFGALTFRILNTDIIRLLVAAVALSFSFNWLLNRGQLRPAARSNAVKGGIWGSLAGFTSFIAHAGGPPLNVYLLPLRLEKSVYIGTCVIFFASINLVKIPPYYWLGQLSPENLLTSAALLPLVPVGMGIGIWAQKRVNERVFYGICYVALIVTGLKLLYDGGKSLLGF